MSGILLDSTVFALPLAARFRGIEQREGVLIHGPSGWGEFAPFPEYSDEVAALWLASAIEAAYGDWPKAKRSEIPVNAIIPALSPQDAAALAYRAVASDGCLTMKIKVGEAGQSLDDDVARIAAVRSALQSATAQQTSIRIDANGAWRVAEAATAIKELDSVAGGLEYVEQPCATFEELAELRKRVSVPIAADELIRTSADPILAACNGATDIVVVKVAPLGGVSVALRVAQAAGVPVVVSGALDSSVGLAAGIALAAALDSLPYACGLGTGALFESDLIEYPLRPVRGQLSVGRIEPDEDCLAQAADRVSKERADWWRRRLVRAWDAGAEALVGPLVRDCRT